MHPNVYSQINIQAIFAVRGRQRFILPAFQEQLFQYMAGLLRQKDCYPLAVGGHRDHVHLFFELNPSLHLSGLLGHVKSTASRWINEQRFLPFEFEWQRSYGAFSYSRSQRDAVIKYIAGQEAHHRVQTFREEYLAFLAKFGIPYEDRFLFEFYDE